MGVVNIKNISTITYRTDLFAGSPTNYHLRRNAVIENIPDGGTTTLYKKGYEKLRDINIKLPDNSEEQVEIGYNPQASMNSRQNPVVADRLILGGDFQPGDMNYSRLVFEKPAIGMGHSGIGVTIPTGSFKIYNELHPQGSFIYGTGSLYLPGSGYSSFSNEKIDELIECYGKQDSEHPTYDIFTLKSVNRIGIGRLFDWGWESSGDSEDGGYYTGSGAFVARTCEQLLDEYRSIDYIELRAVLERDFQYGGLTVSAGYTDWNSGINGYRNHARIGNAGNTWDSREPPYPYFGITDGSDTYLYYLIIPFVSDNEREYTKSALYFWSQSERTAFNNEYDGE